MMAEHLLDFVRTETGNLQQAGLYRTEPVLGSPQRAITSIGGRELTNLASNNYLGLCNHPALRKGAKSAIDAYGTGTASERLVAGQPIHFELERALSDWLNAEDAILLPSGYHANTGLFEPLFGERDSIFLDESCHPSIADGIRLARARVASYRHLDVGDLEDRLKRSRTARFRAIVTDAVFPLEGIAAPLEDLCALGRRYDALLIIDDPHGIGVWGPDGRGTAARLGVAEDVGLISSHFGHALGGGGGGFVAGSSALIGWLRQRSRPHLVSNALAPACAGSALAALTVLQEGTDLLAKLEDRASLLRAGLQERGFDVVEGDHPIVVAIVGSAVAAQRLVDRLYHRGVYVMGFCHPVVAEGQARVRAQVSASHTKVDLNRVLDAFSEAGREIGLL